MRSSRVGSSILFTTMMILSVYGRRTERSIWSSGVTSVQSIMKRMASALSSSERLFFETSSSKPSRSSLTPPLSVRFRACPLSIQRSVMGSRVTPGVGSVMALLFPMSLLNNVDLPTLGLPIITTFFTGTASCSWIFFKSFTSID